MGLLISASNSALSLGVSFQTMFGNMFKLDEINSQTFPDHVHLYEERMARATILGLCVNLGAAAIFMWTLPIGPAQCKEWSARTWWHTNRVACLNIVVFGGPFIWDIYSVLRDVSKS